MSKTHFTLEESDEEICTINTLSKLLKKIIDGGDKRIYLRGLSDFKDDLIPSIGREHHFIGKTVTFDNHHEKQLLSRFRRQAYAQWNRVPNEWESIILARHHGLPNRLLDWTSNPLVALYFACEFDKKDNKEFRDGAIWAIQRSGDEKNDITKKVLNNNIHPFEVKGIKLIYPFYPSQKVIAQSSIFTIQEDPWLCLNDFSDKQFKEKDLDISKMTKWLIPRGDKDEIICDLDRLNINHRSLFPDLYGISKNLVHSIIIKER